MEDGNKFRVISLAPVGRRLLLLEFGYDTDGAPMLNIDLPSDLTFSEKEMTIGAVRTVLHDILPVRFAGERASGSVLLEQLLHRKQAVTTEFVVPIAVRKG